MNPTKDQRWPLSRPCIVPRAVLFDMDGTLTAPLLDFPLIKSEMGIGSGPILEALAEMSLERRAAAMAILHLYEDLAAEQSTLNQGCEELLAWLAARHIGAAIITRNRRDSVSTVMRKHRLSIEVLVTREDGPFKPDPRPLFTAIERLAAHHPQLRPAEVWMVGDGQFDIEAAAAAGVPSVWVAHGRQCPFGIAPWRQVDNLIELLDMLRGGMTNQPAAGGS